MQTISVNGKEYTVDTPVFQVWKTMWLAGSAPTVGFVTVDGKNIVNVGEDRIGGCLVCVEVQDTETRQVVASEFFNGIEFCS